MIYAEKNFQPKKLGPPLGSLKDYSGTPKHERNSSWHPRDIYEKIDRKFSQKFFLGQNLIKNSNRYLFFRSGLSKLPRKNGSVKKPENFDDYDNLRVLKQIDFSWHFLPTLSVKELQFRIPPQISSRGEFLQKMFVTFFVDVTKMSRTVTFMFWCTRIILKWS